MPLRIVPYQQQTTPSMGGMPRAQAPAVSDALGHGVSVLAKEFAEYGQKIYTAQKEADLQDRIGRATVDLAELELSLERDQDFRTSPERFQEGADAIREKYLDGVTDQAVTTAFKKRFGELALAKSLNVRKAAFGKERDYNVAALDTNIDVYAQAAATAKNPAEAALVENQARIAIASAQNGGWISAEDAGKRERTFLSKRDTAVVLRDLSLDPSLTAAKLSLDPTYAANVDPVQRERFVDQAVRRSDAERIRLAAQAEKDRKARGDELYKEAISRGDKGTLNHAYVEEIKAFIEPAEYKALLKTLSGEEKTRDDPTAYAALEGLVETNPSEARRKAFDYHRNGFIRNETLRSINERSRGRERQEGPKSAYERERLYISNAIKPSDLAPDAAQSARFAIVIREYDDFALGGQRTDKELRGKADALLKHWLQVDMVDLARKTALGAQPTPEQQLGALAVEGARLKADLDAKKITPQEFNRKMETLNRARKAAEKAMSDRGN